MHVRPMHADDLPAVRELSAQLGYPTGEDALAARFARIDAMSDAAIFVAEHDHRVIGWVEVHSRWVLESEPCAEIVGLVVDGMTRRQGAGRALVSQVEEWARQQGFARVRVRSNAARVESHAFYPALGYERRKTQHTYERALRA